MLEVRVPVADVPSVCRDVSGAPEVAGLSAELVAVSELSREISLGVDVAMLESSDVAPVTDVGSSPVDVAAVALEVPVAKSEEPPTLASDVPAESDSIPESVPLGEVKSIEEPETVVGESSEVTPDRALGPVGELAVGSVFSACESPVLVLVLVFVFRSPGDVFCAPPELVFPSPEYVLRVFVFPSPEYVFVLVFPSPEYVFVLVFPSPE